MREKGSGANRKITAGFFALLFILTCVAASGVWFWNEKSALEEKKERQNEILALNEIQELSRNEEGVSPAEAEIRSLMQEISAGEQKQNRYTDYIVTGMYMMCILAATLLYIYIYRVILRPFRKMEQYAEEVARGNLDIPITYERTNIFGAFTWAFDQMRTEIIKARRCEKEAVENNKTVIATLSHDIKTPIASVRAYAEGLEANMDAGPERRARYLQVIMKKCDEVTELTNDLFLHSLSDMDRLEVKKEPVRLDTVIMDSIEAMSGNREDLKIRGSLEPVTVIGDEKRLCQALENVINNARKYAPQSGMEIWVTKEEKECTIHLKDFGEGIPPEDMPFIFQKFYRGKSTEDKPGAGLGLYIVQYIMEQMEGTVSLKNSPDGLEVQLKLKMQS